MNGYLSGEIGGCTQDEQCEWLFSCQEGECTHQAIFPLSFYPVLIYLLIPLASGLANVTGNSMGVFKVFIMMNLLRYQVAQSTALIQPMVAGTAIPNFLMMIFQRHPFRCTSLVNYSIVYILIPAGLFGSTVGALLGNFVPQIVQDSCIMLVFSYFTFNFVIKARMFAKDQKQLAKTQDNQEEEKQSQEDIQEKVNPRASLLTSQQGSMIQSEAMDPEKRDKLAEIQAYEDKMQIPSIVASFVCFIAFEALVFLVQGKLPFLSFGKCDWEYPVGIALLTVITVIYLIMTKRFITIRLKKYKEVGYPLDIDLSINKNFWLVFLGGFGAGFMQGVLGVGSGTCTMAVLLALNIPPRVASACSGYQVFFVGAASLIEELINGDLILQEIGFLVGLTAIFGGIATFLMYSWIKKRNITKVNQILLHIMCVFCIISVFGVIPSFITTVTNFGWEEVLKIKWSC